MLFLGTRVRINENANPPQFDGMVGMVINYEDNVYTVQFDTPFYFDNEPIYAFPFGEHELDTIE